MTESCSCITTHPPGRYVYRYATRVGTIVTSTEVKIVDSESSKEFGMNEAGEIWTGGPRYLNNEKTTSETFDTDGFLHTGDFRAIDEEGFISITDQLKEMIKVKGIGVARAELEDVAVIGDQDEKGGGKTEGFCGAEV